MKSRRHGVKSGKYFFKGGFMAVNRKIRIGIIGVGQIGKHHIAKYKELPDVELVGCSDINEK